MTHRTVGDIQAFPIEGRRFESQLGGIGRWRRLRNRNQRERHPAHQQKRGDSGNDGPGPEVPGAGSVQKRQQDEEHDTEDGNHNNSDDLEFSAEVLQQLEDEEEVPLGAGDIVGGKRVGLFVERCPRPCRDPHQQQQQT